MQTHIIIDGRVANSIMATVAEAQEVYPEALCLDAAIGGYIGDFYDPETSEFTSPEPQPAPVPTSVTRRQARQALLLASLLDDVQPAIDAISDPVQRGMAQIEWDDSQEFHRDRPTLIALATAIGLDSAQLDQLFVTAAGL